MKIILKNQLQTVKTIKMSQTISFHKSPNFTPGRLHYKPEAIVIHIMEGTLSGTDSWFGSTKSVVSAHYGIALNGDIHQYVKEEDTAWHAGRVDNPSWQLIKPGKTKSYINPNYYTIGIEHEGNEYSKWSDLLYQTSATLIKDICERNHIPFDRQHIIGHHEIYSKKTCPGYVVNINKLIALAKGESFEETKPTSEIVGSVITNSRLKIRTGSPTLSAPVKTIVNSGTQLKYSSLVKGEDVQGVSDWYTDGNNSFWWSGACTML